MAYAQVTHAADATAALTAYAHASDTLRQYAAGTSAEDAARADAISLRFDEQPNHHFHSTHGPTHVSNVSFTTITDASGHTTPADTPERLAHALSVAGDALATLFQQRATDPNSGPAAAHPRRHYLSGRRSRHGCAPCGTRASHRGGLFGAQQDPRAGRHPGRGLRAVVVGL